MRDTALRTVPSGGTTEKIAVLKYDDPVEGTTDVKHEQYSQYGHPLSLIKIAATTTTAGDYPASIASITGGTSSTVQFNSTPAISPVGMLIRFISATNNTNEVARIISLASGSTYNLSRTLTGAVTNGDTYDLLIDCYRMNSIIVKSEFSNGTGTADLILSFYDIGKDAVTPTPSNRALIRYQDVAMSVDNLNFNTGITEGGYYHGQTRSSTVWGALGAKVRLVAAPSSSASISIWAGCV